MWLLSGAQGKGREREREREREKEKKKKKKKKRKRKRKRKGEREKKHTSKKTQRRKHTAAERSKALESMRPPPTASPKIIPTFRYTYHNRCDKTTCITSTTLVLRKTTKPNMAILGVRDCENMRKFSSCVLSEISSFSFLEHRNLAKSNRFGNSIATDWILKNALKFWNLPRLPTHKSLVTFNPKSTLLAGILNFSKPRNPVDAVDPMLNWAMRHLVASWTRKGGKK